MVFLGGVIIIGFLWFLGKNYAAANPKQLAALLRKIGGWVVIVFAALLALRGRMDLALLAGGTGWWLVQGRRLDAYLNSRFSIRSEDAHENPDPGTVHNAGLGSMTEQEALDVLGLPKGATAAQIRSAHRVLMKKLHPDQGGSNYLATRVNQAKDVLLDGHY